METTFIYALCEPNSRTVRYIGKANNPKKRLIEHLKISAKYQTHLGYWLRNLTARGEKPSLEVLREIPVQVWQQAEERYIRLARGLGMVLVNGTDGGDGLHNPTPEVRAKIRASRLGKKLKLSDESRERKRQAFLGANNPQFGKERPASHCEALSKAHKGRKLSEETKQKLRVAHTGKKWPGRKLSEAHKKAIGDSIRGEKNGLFGKTGKNHPQFGSKRSDEVRSKMRLSKIGPLNPRFGKKMTEEEIARRTASYKANRQKKLGLMTSERTQNED